MIQRASGQSPGICLQHRGRVLVVRPLRGDQVSIIMLPKLSMEPATQLAVFLSNRPGALARVCDAPAKADIMVHAFATSDTVVAPVVGLRVGVRPAGWFAWGGGGFWRWKRRG